MSSQPITTELVTFMEMRADIGAHSSIKVDEYFKLRKIDRSMPHYDDKYTLRAEISETGKIDDMTRIPKGTWHMIWNQLSATTKWAIVEDIFGEFVLVDVPTTMRDDLAKTYMGEFTTHKSIDAAIMFAMIMRGKR